VENLYATTEVSFDLTYVDVASPRPVREALRELADGFGFRVVRTEKVISPNRARNIGLRYASGEYVVFVDNDVAFLPGWLESLIECAAATGAEVVGPLYLEGPIEERVVHMAGGDMKFSGQWGSREFVQNQRYFLTKLADVPQEDLRRQECDIIEFHCALVRHDMLERAGWMDEGLLTTREHLDFCLRVQATGGRIFFEPKAVMTYLTPPPFERHDLGYFLVRWSDLWTRETLVHFAHKYGIAPSYVDRVAKTRARRHRLLLGWLLPDDRPGAKALRGLVGGLLRLAEPTWTGWRARRALKIMTGPQGLGAVDEYVGRTGASRATVGA
jgi:glycosyltransferase involved in cell wall biosynthesis